MERLAARQTSGARLRFSLRGGGLRGHGLIDLEIGHLQFAKKIEEERVFLRSQIALGFLVKCVEHVDKFARRFGIDHRLAGAWVRVRAQDHGGIAAQHANQVLESRRAVGSLRGRRCHSRFGGLCWRRGWTPRGLALRFALFLFDSFLAQFYFGGKGTPVDDSKGLFLLVVGQGAFLSSVLVNFSIEALVWVAGVGQEKDGDEELGCVEKGLRPFPQGSG